MRITLILLNLAAALANSYGVYRGSMLNGICMGLSLGVALMLTANWRS